MMCPRKVGPGLYFIKGKNIPKSHLGTIIQCYNTGLLFQKSVFYFSRDHCCEVTVKNVQKSIFSMF